MALDFQLDKMDYVSDMLCRIKNISNIKKQTCIIKKSKICIEILKLLQKIGYVNFFNINSYNIIINLKYKNNKSCIKIIKRISKPGSRIYLTSKQIKNLIKINNGFFIISTNQGIKIDVESLLLGLGGEVLFYIK